MAAYERGAPNDLLDLAKQSSAAADQVRQALKVFGRLPAPTKFSGHTAEQIGDRWALIHRRLVRLADQYDEQASLLRAMSDWVHGRIETIRNARHACEREVARLSGQLAASQAASQVTAASQPADVHARAVQQKQLAGLAQEQDTLRGRIDGLQPGYAPLDVGWPGVAQGHGVHFEWVR